MIKTIKPKAKAIQEQHSKEKAELVAVVGLFIIFTLVISLAVLSITLIQ